MAAEGKAVCGEKGGGRTDKENSDIYRCNVVSKDSSIRIVEDRNQQTAGKQAGHQAGGRTGKGSFGFSDDKEAVEQHRKKEQLDVLPDRFTDGAEQADERVIAGPFIAKVRECSKNGDKEEA